VWAAECCGERYLDRWDELIAGGPDVLTVVLLEETDEGQVLRSICPFGGILSEDERLQIISDCWNEAR
jgi:hypothetical protein